MKKYIDLGGMLCISYKYVPLKGDILKQKIFRYRQKKTWYRLFWDFLSNVTKLSQRIRIYRHEKRKKVIEMHKDNKSKLYMKCERMDILMLHTNTRTDMLQAMNVYKIKLLHAVSVYEWFILCMIRKWFHYPKDFINGLKNLLIIIFVKYKNF